MSNAKYATVWARDVAKAMENQFYNVDCPFYWARALEDTLQAKPTIEWPHETFPSFVYQAQEGGNEGIHIHVLVMQGEGTLQPLLMAKFLTSIKKAGDCLSLVIDFVENFKPAQLQACKQ